MTLHRSRFDWATMLGGLAVVVAIVLVVVGLLTVLGLAVALVFG